MKKCVINMEKKKIDIAFVILHYMAANDTVECVESVMAHNDTDRIHIIVVDNASPDGSGEKLRQRYENEKCVTVICNEKNLGFANGNNVGFRYAKENFDCRYIVLSNNDIIIFQDEMLRRLDEEYEKSRFAVWGPMVLTKDGRYGSSPSRMKPLTKAEAEDFLRDYENFLKFQNMHLRWLYIIYRKKILKRGRRPKLCDHYRKYYDVSIHGCFMVFSREYIDRFDGLCDKTFMYGEEDILYQSLINNKLKSVYDPSYAIYHKEDVSTDTAQKSGRKKREFYYKNLIASIKILISMYDE